MTVTAASFRIQFPEFTSAVTYPDALVNTWLAVAVKMVNADRWGELTDLGVALFAAHWILLAAANQRATTAGRAPGTMRGVLTSKSADGLSASYDVSASNIEGANHYNLTTYGVQFKDMARMMGAGPVYIGIGSGSDIDQAWQGVLQPIHG